MTEVSYILRIVCLLVPLPGGDCPMIFMTALLTVLTPFNRSFQLISNTGTTRTISRSLEVGHLDVSFFRLVYLQGSFADI